MLNVFDNFLGKVFAFLGRLFVLLSLLAWSCWEEVRPGRGLLGEEAGDGAAATSADMLVLELARVEFCSMCIRATVLTSFLDCKMAEVDGFLSIPKRKKGEGGEVKRAARGEEGSQHVFLSIMRG